MSGKLWPRLGDLRFSFDMLSETETALLSDEAHRALMRLVAFAATRLVWTYSAPSDGSLPSDDPQLAKIVRMDSRKWRRVRKEVEEFFKSRGGKWHLNREWIGVDDRPVRFAIPGAVQQEVLSRQGRVCTYCGDTGGPFDFDHILPVSRGGPNDASNLTLACATCNRSKGAKTLMEWVTHRGGRGQ